MKRFVKFAGIATLVAVLAVGAVGAVALAQEGSEDNTGFNLRERLHQAIAGILGITVEEYDAAVDAAQEQADRLQERMDLGAGARWMGKGFLGGRGGWGMRGSASLFSVAADELGISLIDLMAQLQEGRSMAEVAADHEVDAQTIADAYLAQLEENLTDAVENGRITQKQADSMLENMAECVASQIEATWGDCRPGGFMGHGGRGGFGGFRGFPGWGES
jgi:hypothetical protein